MAGITVFHSVSEALRAGFSVYERTSTGIWYAPAPARLGPRRRSRHEPSLRPTRLSAAGSDRAATWAGNASSPDDMRKRWQTAWEEAEFPARSARRSPCAL